MGNDVITKELLRSWGPCADGYKRFCELFPDGATLTTAIEGLVADGHNDWGWWLFTACQKAGFAGSETARGYRNSGNRNSGNWNSGDWNSGDWNSGDRNSGNWNSGDWNSGDWNSGDWNSGNWNSGFFNIDTPAVVRVFGRDCPRAVWNNAVKPEFLYFSTTEWVDIKAMTDDEKCRYPWHALTGGYLRASSYKEAFKRSWDRADKIDRMKIKNLPNFDAQIFFEISGIDLRDGKDGD